MVNKEIDNLDAFKELCYAFSQEHVHSCILDSCSLDPQGRFEFIAAFGAKEFITKFEDIEKIDSSPKWWFGILSYDCKNKIEDLQSTNPSLLNCPEVSFFSPEILITISKDNQKNRIEVVEGELPADFITGEFEQADITLSPEINPLPKGAYLYTIQTVQDLIREGEVYELNFCVNHSFKYSQFQPELFQHQLVSTNPAPMATFFKAKEHVLCGASMERFISLKNGQLKSQPIKGTIGRGNDNIEDEMNKQQLSSSEKDRAENVMIVDLVRNDLNRICETGSVRVPELFGIHSFPKVHQMISTVVGDIKRDFSILDVIHALFPMGSMTGAPKIAAMKYIDQLENFKREWYSGAVGYITPENDFDFNVVIRSLIANTEKKCLSYSAGGAITIDSDPELEWEEMRLKTKSIESVLNNRT